MPAPIAIQLYSLRELAEKDYAAVVRKVAAMGYVGVETAGFPGTNAKAAAKLFKELGLQVPSAHTELPIGDKQNEVVETAQTIGTKRVISGFGPDQYKTVAGIKKACEKFNQAQEVCKKHGMQFGMHNHWWEFDKVDGKLVFDYLLKELDPGIFFEVDTYWAKVGGADPAEFVGKLGKRAPLLHIKDGPLVKGKPHTAVGDGKMDFPAIVAAAKGVTEWMIVELDECGTDMAEAVEKSCRFLVGKGLAKGK